MNFFQRLSYLKQWYDDNHTVYLENRKFYKTAFDKKYKNELKRYTLESKNLKKRREIALKKEEAISYQDWTEVQFKMLLQKLSHTIVDFQKKDFLEQFDIWLRDFAVLDFKFRLYSIELYYKVEITKFNTQFDVYIESLRKAHSDWLYNEDSKFNDWLEKHPLYQELQELEYQYDCMEDNDSVRQTYSYNHEKSKSEKYQANYIPSAKESLIISVEKPSPVNQYNPSYF